MQSLLDAVTLQGGDETAIIYIETDTEPITVTRADFAKQVQRYAASMAGHGIGPRDLVIIAHTQNMESIYAFWAAMLLGAIPSMFPTLTEKLDPAIYMSNMATLVEHSGTRAILTSDDFAPQLAPAVGCPVIASSQLSEHAVEFSVADTPSDEVAFLQHSSGTTGLQKGIALSHTAALNHLRSYRDALQLSADDVIVSWLPLYHDMGLITGFLMPLMEGIPLVLMSPFDWVSHPAMLLRALEDYHGTLCWLPNFAYQHLARRVRKRDTEGIDLSGVRAFINCSEPVHHSSHQSFLERFADNGVRADQLAVSYAMAENTFAVTQTPIGREPVIDVVDRAALENEQRATPIEPDAPTAQINVSCGPPIDAVQVRVLDASGNQLPERGVGELAVRSNFMLSGYYKRPDLNETLFVDGWYLTGDMGYIADGEIYISGRKKDLIINSGKNVYPQDLEAIVNSIPGVHPGRAVAFGVYDERDGTELIGIVAEVHADDDETRRAIGGQIRERIATQTTVTASYVHLVEEKWLIKTSSGKIARAANRDKWQAETGRG
jgi:acyl-CoA synthetase (AMP-forming)/AMP-acid ligase II